MPRLPNPNTSTSASGSAARRLFARVRGEGGQALVEFALVIPLLLIVLLGIVDFGRAINYWNDENHLAELGARLAAVGYLPTSGACGGQTSLTAYLNCQAGTDSSELQKGSGGKTGVTGSGATYDVCVPNNAVGETVQVQVKAGYNWLPMPGVLANGFQFTQTTLKGTATMRLENVLPSSWINDTGPCPT